MTRSADRGKTVKTSMRLSRALLDAAAEKIVTIGMSRTKYIEFLLRKDLGFATIDQRLFSSEDTGEAV